MVDKELHSFLTKLGLDTEAVSIYLALVNKPAQPAQAIARDSGVPKTTVYRRLEELVYLGLVEERVEEYKTLYKNSGPDMLKLLLAKKEQQIKELESELPTLLSFFSPTQSQDPETKVLFYRGSDGIQQMNWNVLKTKGEMCGYTFRAWEEIVGEKFAREFLLERNERNFSGREIYSQEYLKSRKNNPDPIAKWTNWQSRYIDPKIVDITHQVDIYNDVVAIYNWHQGEVFGVELYNPKVATMQKQVFNVLWQLAKS